MGETRDTAFGAARPEDEFSLYFRRHLPGRRKRRRARTTLLQQRGHGPASRRNLACGRTKRACARSSRSGRVACLGEASRPGQHALRPHISQYVPACRNSRSWLAVAFVHEVRSAARCVFHDLMVIFGLAPPAVDILVKDTGVADLQVRDDEARVRPFRADFDACDDPLDPAPAFGPIEELLEAAELASGGACRPPSARPRSASSCWPRCPRHGGAMSWSARRPGCNPRPLARHQSRTSGQQ